MATLVLATAACAPGGLATPAVPAVRSVSPTPSVPTTLASSASPQVRGSLGLTTRLSTLGLGSWDIQIVGDSLLWIDRDISADRQGRGQIVEASLGNGAESVLYRAANEHGQIAAMASSVSWVVWAEYEGEPAHARIYAMPRDGGSRVLLDDMAAHALAYLPDFAIDGADVYWTLPLIDNGVWKGRLLHRRLPDGPTEVLLQARDHFMYGWPSAHGGRVAFEVADQLAKGSQPRYRIDLRELDGSIRQLPIVPASEPSLGDGVLAVKHADRFGEGPVAVFDLSSGRTADLRDGEGPQVSAPLIVWHSGHPGDPGGPGNYWSSGASGGCFERLGPNVPPEEASLSAPAAGPGRVAWVYRRTSGPDPREVIETAAVLHAPCQ